MTIQGGGHTRMYGLDDAGGYIEGNVSLLVANAECGLLIVDEHARMFIIGVHLLMHDHMSMLEVVLTNVQHASQ